MNAATPERQKETNSDWNFPVMYLQLSTRAFNACDANDCKTLLSVREAFLSDKLSELRIGRKTSQEIANALTNLNSCEKSDGSIDWPRFWELRDFAPTYTILTSKELQRLNLQNRAQPIGILHLRKACSGLESAGIRNLGALVDKAKSGIGRLENFGKVARKEVTVALTALSHTVEEDGTVDWNKYATVRGFRLLPADPGTSSSAAHILQIIPDICSAVVTAQFGDREWQIFRRRLIVPESTRETLESLGAVYGITRERVRQLEGYCIDALRKPLLMNDYRGLEFRFQSGLVDAFRDGKEHFDSVGLPAWKESDWMAELADLWRVPIALIEKFDRLLSELMGYEVVRPDYTSLEPLVLSSSTPIPETNRIVKSVDTIHDRLSNEVRGTDSFELVRALKKVGITSATPDDIPTLVSLCSSVEVAGDDSNIYRLKFTELKGRANQAARVLYEKGAPLHYAEILREINRRLPEKRRIEGKENLVNQLSNDERLLPIGKSGNWSLTEWGAEARSLVDIIEDILATAGEALPVSVITEKVLAARTGSAASIPMILTFNPDRFRRVAPSVYALTAWGDSPDEGAPVEDSIAEFVEGFFEKLGAESIDFKELRKAFARKTGLSPRSAAGVLANSPAVSITMPNSYVRIASYNPNWRSQPQAPRKYQRTKPLQSEIIVEQAKKFLISSPQGELPLIKVVTDIEKGLGIGRVNIYSAVSQCEDLEKVVIEGSAFKVLRLRAQKSPAFPQLAQIKFEDWRKECQRGVAKLTPEEVDIGLFILGRQFDQAMKQLLTDAKAAGLVVLSGHTERLKNRIDWAFGQGLFTDKPTLEVLRVERNERGHNAPTDEERKAAMKYAPYLAGLYLDYLLMIEHHIEGFRAKGSAPAPPSIP